MINYILIALLVIIIILQIINIFRKKDDNDLIERLGKLEKSVSNDMNDFKFDISKHLTEDIDKLNEKIEKKLLVINNQVNERIDQNFEKTNKTFNNVLERLTKIDEAQKKIDSLSTEIVNLQSVLTDKKTRGIFGEVNLNYILTSIFGESKGKIYDIQHTMSNGSIADSIIYAPEPLGTICIDLHYSLEGLKEQGLDIVRLLKIKLLDLVIKKNIKYS